MSSTDEGRFIAADPEQIESTEIEEGELIVIESALDENAQMEELKVQMLEESKMIIDPSPVTVMMVIPSDAASTAENVKVSQDSSINMPEYFKKTSNHEDVELAEEVVQHYSHESATQPSDEVNQEMNAKEISQDSEYGQIKGVSLDVAVEQTEAQNQNVNSDAIVIEPEDLNQLTTEEFPTDGADNCEIIAKLAPLDLVNSETAPKDPRLDIENLPVAVPSLKLTDFSSSADDIAAENLETAQTMDIDCQVLVDSASMDPRLSHVATVPTDSNASTTTPTVLSDNQKKHSHRRPVARPRVQPRKPDDDPQAVAQRRTNRFLDSYDKLVTNIFELFENPDDAKHAHSYLAQSLFMRIYPVLYESTQSTASVPSMPMTGHEQHSYQLHQSFVASTNAGQSLLPAESQEPQAKEWINLEVIPDDEREIPRTKVRSLMFL